MTNIINNSLVQDFTGTCKFEVCYTTGNCADAYRAGDEANQSYTLATNFADEAYSNWLSLEARYIYKLAYQHAADQYGRTLYHEVNGEMLPVIEKVTTIVDASSPIANLYVKVDGEVIYNPQKFFEGHCRVNRAMDKDVKLFKVVKFEEAKAYMNEAYAELEKIRAAKVKDYANGKINRGELKASLTALDEELFFQMKNFDKAKAQAKKNPNLLVKVYPLKDKNGWVKRLTSRFTSIKSRVNSYSEGFREDLYL